MSLTIAIPTLRRYDKFLQYSLPKYLQIKCVKTIVIGDETGEDNDKIRKQEWGQDEKFQLITNSERLGAYNNKLNLLYRAETDWIAMIDSDNEIDDAYFTALHIYWDQHGINDMCVYMPSNTVKVFEDGSELNANSNEFAGHKINSTNWNAFLKTGHLANYLVNIGNCVFHRNAAKAFPEIDSKDVMLEVKKMNKALVENGYTLIFVPNMVYKHRVHANSYYLSFKDEMDLCDKTTNWYI
jgi:hypothetical protein